ncbi:MAG: site-specific integrase [Bacteroidota bacterium]
MATIKIVLRRKKNKDGTSPLALRIIKDRKASYIHLGYHCFEKDWDALSQRVRKSHPNAVRLNNLIMKRLADASDVALEIDAQQKDASSTTIKRKIKPVASGLFFAQADLFLTRLKETGNFNVWHAETPRLRNFKEFVLGTAAVRDELPKRALSFKRPPCQGVLAGPDVSFAQIDVGLLRQFKVHLKAQLGISDRTIANYLIVIQAIFSQAIKEGVSDGKHFPFGREKIRIKLPETQKVGLTKDDVEKLEALALAHPAHAAARDAWLLSFYFAGMRAADVLQLRWSDVRDGRLHYVMEKNGKPVSLKVPQKAQGILDRYEDGKRHPNDFIFPYLKGFAHLDDEFALKKRIAGLVSQCDGLLAKRVAPAAGIEAKLSMHIARHTFATLAGDKIPIQMLQKLYRHSDIKTTLAYQSAFIHKDADEALDAVLGG